MREQPAHARKVVEQHAPPMSLPSEEGVESPCYPSKSSSNRKERVSDEPCSDQDSKHRSENSIGETVATIGSVHLVAIAWPGGDERHPVEGRVSDGVPPASEPSGGRKYVGHTKSPTDRTKRTSHSQVGFLRIPPRL
jgi:hypothetical protein